MHNIDFHAVASHAVASEKKKNINSITSLNITSTSSLFIKVKSEYKELKQKVNSFYMKKIIYSVRAILKINIYNILEIFSITIVKIIFVKGIKNKYDCFRNFTKSENWLIKSIYNFIIFRSTFVLINRIYFVGYFINSTPETNKVMIIIFNSIFIPLKELYEDPLIILLRKNISLLPLKDLYEDPLIILLHKNISLLLIYLSNMPIWNILYNNFFYIHIFVFSILFLCFLSSLIFIILFISRDSVRKVILTLKDLKI